MKIYVLSGLPKNSANGMGNIPLREERTVNPTSREGLLLLLRKNADNVSQHLAVGYQPDQALLAMGVKPQQIEQLRSKLAQAEQVLLRQGLSLRQIRSAIVQGVRQQRRANGNGLGNTPNTTTNVEAGSPYQQVASIANQLANLALTLEQVRQPNGAAAPTAALPTLPDAPRTAGFSLENINWKQIGVFAGIASTLGFFIYRMDHDPEDKEIQKRYRKTRRKSASSRKTTKRKAKPRSTAKRKKKSLSGVPRRVSKIPIVQF